MPIHPVHPGGGVYPVAGQRLIAVDRGPVAKGPWANPAAFHGPAIRPDHEHVVSFRGNTLAPVARVDVRPQAFVAAKGTAPGTRAVLGGTGVAVGQRPASNSSYLWGANPPRAVERPGQPVGSQQMIQRAPVVSPRPNAYSPPPVQSYNQRSTYVARPEAAPHYSPPPQQHYSAPPASHSAPAGNHR